MLFIIALVMAFCFSFFCEKAIKKYPYVFYGIAVLISVLVATMDFHNLPQFINTYIVGLFTRGALATALWCVVMWTGALPNGSALIKKFMPIRGELSIISAILTLGHNIGFGKIYFVRLFTDASRMTKEQITASILTIIMLTIMIPLTVMSFPKIRKKMNAKLWKKIQRTAYIFYACIYIHVMVLCLPMAKAGRDGYFLSVLIYSIVFIGYAICRIRKQYLIKNKPDNKIISSVIAKAFFIAFVFGVGFYAVPDKKNAPVDNIEPVKNTASTSTTTTASTTNTTTKTTVTTTITTTDAITTTSSSTDTSETTTSTEETTETTEIIATEPEAPPQEEPPTTAKIITEPEPVYIYKNGTYSASAYGYDGEVYITLTIENDVITDITGYSEESDTWYFDSAYGSVIGQIIASQNANVDAYSGATYSSNAIMTAVRNALESARN